MLQISNNVIESAKRVFEIEAKSISNLSNNLDKNFPKIINLIYNSKGKVIISGIGKSGLIGKKISATLSSTGTPSYFLHPTEAYHGDFGLVQKDDIIILISNSGESDEVLKTIPFFQNNGNKIVAMTSNKNSTLGKNSDFFLNISVLEEACPLQLAPTSSTTVTLAMGDAIAVALIEIRNFKKIDFAKFHPGGALGRKLLTKVSNVMETNNLPIASETTPIIDIIHKISQGGLGVVVILKNKKVIGIITDGDIRRAMETKQKEFFNLIALNIMSINPKVILTDEKLSIAENIFIKYKIGAIIVVDKNFNLNGILKPFH